VTWKLALSTAATSPARNYTLEAAPALKLVNQVIEQGTPTAADFVVKFGSTVVTGDAPVVTTANGSAKSVTVAWKEAANGAITVKYDTEDTRAPKEIGDYKVLVSTVANANFAAVTDLEVAEISIVDGLFPWNVQVTPDTSFYAGGSVTLRVSAKNPVDTTKTTGITQQWYQVKDDGALEKKGTQALLTVTSAVEASLKFVVDVTYKSADQVAKTTRSPEITVTVYPPPKSLSGAEIVAKTEYTYDGTKMIPTADDFDVKVDGAGLTAGVDYELPAANVTNNTNAGEGRVVIRGINAWKDTKAGYFTINKRELRLEDLNITYNVNYTGAVQHIPVASKIAGNTFTVTRIYSPDTVPKDAGTWSVRIAIAESDNFTALDTTPLAADYKISELSWDAETMLNVAGLTNGVKRVAWNGQNQGIPVPTVKGVATSYTGAVSVLYENAKTAEVTPEAVGGPSDTTEYLVKVRFTADKNFRGETLEIGTITVYDSAWVSVAQGGRVIPTGETVELGAIAPVKVVASQVTVGPNPVSGNGAVNVYWNGGKSVKGKLVVFSSVGKKVASVNVSGKGKIGTWTANNVAEGTYLIKGVLKSESGEKIKVSTLVGVAK